MATTSKALVEFEKLHFLRENLRRATVLKNIIEVEKRQPTPEEEEANKPLAGPPPPITQEKHVKLYGGFPSGDKFLFINKMDSSLATLVNCEHLSLSTNQIVSISNLTGLSKLKILSLSRNLIRKIERLEDVADTLEELWISYNSISSLDGVLGCKKLRVLYIAYNRISDISELDKLAVLPELKCLNVYGNPFFDAFGPSSDKERDNRVRLAIYERLPNLEKIDDIETFKLTAPSS